MRPGHLVACYQRPDVRTCVACSKVEHRCAENPYSGNCTRDAVRINVHHIQPRKFGGSNAGDNLIVLCSKCHARTHKFYEEQAIKIAMAASPDFFNECMDAFVRSHGLPKP